jgi:hypothetical protein
VFAGWRMMAFTWLLLEERAEGTRPFIVGASVSSSPWGHKVVIAAAELFMGFRWGAVPRDVVPGGACRRVGIRNVAGPGPEQAHSLRWSGQRP